jgi:hypothetical protein
MWVPNVAYYFEKKTSKLWGSFFVHAMQHFWSMYSFILSSKAQYQIHINDKDTLTFCWPCIIMYHNNVTNLIHFHFHNHFIVSWYSTCFGRQASIFRRHYTSSFWCELRALVAFGWFKVVGRLEGTTLAVFRVSCVHLLLLAGFKLWDDWKALH